MTGISPKKEESVYGKGGGVRGGGVGRAGDHVTAKSLQAAVLGKADRESERERERQRETNLVC